MQVSVQPSRRRAHARAAAPMSQPASRAHRRSARATLALAAALSLGGLTASTALAADTAPPTAPGPLTETITGVGATTLHWGASTDNVAVTAYDVYLGTTVIGTVSGSTTSLAVTASVQGGPQKTYAYSVVARDAAGNASTPSDTLTRYSCGPIFGAGPTPTGVTASNITGTSATISWTPSALPDWCHAAPTGYVVQVDNGAAPSLSAGASDTSVQLIGLNPGTTHTVRIQVLPQGPNAQPTDLVVFKTTGGDTATDTTAPTAPGPLTATALQTTTADYQLSWGASTDDTGVAGYDIVSGTTVLKTVDGTTTTTKLSALSLSASVQFPLSVVAFDAAGNRSAASNKVTINTCPAVPNHAPPTNPTVDSVTSGGAHLTWTAPVSGNCIYATDHFEIWTTGANPVKLGATAAASTAVTLSGLTPDTSYTVGVRAIAVDGASTQSTQVTFKTTAGGVDTTAPTAPGPLTETITGIGKTTLHWGASTDDTAVTAYEVYEGTTLLQTVSGTTTSAAVTASVQGGPTKTYAYSVRAVDAAGNRSEPSNTLTRSSCGPIFGSAPTPTDVKVGNITQTNAVVSWTPGVLTSWCQTPATDYTLQFDGEFPGQTVLEGKTSAVVSGLTPGTSHTFRVLALPQGPIASPSAPVTFSTTDGGPVTGFPYVVAGSATLKNLAKGTVSLTGTASSTITNGTAFSASLNLNSSVANLKALGILPVTATVNLTTTEPVVGTLAGGGLNATAKVRIKLPSIKTFGIQLAGGANCQATQVSTIPLSASTFSAETGGTLSGTFSISNLSGCGALNGIVSPLTAGGGNAVALKFSRPPVL